MNETLVPTSPIPQGATPVVGGGLVRMVSAAQLESENHPSATDINNAPLMQGLAAHVRSAWELHKRAKEEVEQRMLRSERQRRGEYEPDILRDIKDAGGSELFMMLTSNKCRAAKAWILDTLLGVGDDKPWGLRPTPIPDLPPTVAASVQRLAIGEIRDFIMATGTQPTPEQTDEVIVRIKDRILANARAQAKLRAKRMEDKMEDQLLEGNFREALVEFIDDYVQFPAAIMKGPVVRNKPRLQWLPSESGFEMHVENKLVEEWERVDPYRFYPAPHATDVNDGDTIELHRMTRTQLNGLIGVEGYSEDAIREVLDAYGAGGLREWLRIDSDRKQMDEQMHVIESNPTHLIDAIQYMGSVQGKHLIEWGMDEAAVPDPLKDYECEVWLIGSWVIKAVVNPHPLGQKPYYKACYEEIPGSFWGNAVPDLCRDSQTQCNTAARSIANNMSIASGPQVVYNVDRLPSGENLSKMYPWKVWQTTSDPYANQGKPVEFFMPTSIANELMSIYTFFSNLADETTGVPRYMTGDASVGGAGRTASGMSMLMSNAGKSVKAVISNLDLRLFTPLLERLYYHNMRFSDDNELKGDVTIVARGSSALILKEQQQVRVNEFLQLALSSPAVQGIVGEEAIAEMLRYGAKNLDFDTDSLIPPAEIIRARIAQQQQQQQMLLAMQMGMAGQPSESIEFERGADGAVTGAKVMPGNQQRLMNGAPVTDNFAPKRAA